MDTLASYFNSHFEQKNLLDLQPFRLESSWRNNRGEENAISERLNRFLLLEGLLQETLVFKLTVETSGLSNHRTISLSITRSEANPPPPFRFNPNWPEHEEYRELVKIRWKPIQTQSTEGCMY